MTIIITNYRNARYINSIGDVVDCEVQHPTHGWIPFTLDVRDPYSTIDVNSLLSVMKTAGAIAAYVPPTKGELDAILSSQLREKRDALLLEVDSIAGNALRWGDLSAEQREAWAVYRQGLLDVPQQPSFPSTVQWPVKPA
jgi:hypothetical protein